MSRSFDLDEKKAAGDSSTSTTEEQVISRPTSHHNEPQHDLEKHEEEVGKDTEPYLNPLSTATTRESTLPPPPDGGFHAWMKVFGGFLIYINIWCVGPM